MSRVYDVTLVNRGTGATCTLRVFSNTRDMAKRVARALRRREQSDEENAHALDVVAVLYVSKRDR